MSPTEQTIFEAVSLLAGGHRAGAAAQERPR